MSPVAGGWAVRYRGKEPTGLGLFAPDAAGVSVDVVRLAVRTRECEATLTDFFITAEHLLAKGVAVASVLPETSEKVVADAKAMLAASGKKTPGSWIVDTEKNPISARLKVQSVPAVVLISAEGRILFNGHPTDDEFWKALEKIDPGIVRPEMREGD